jgi:fused signal recognition particle receptor
MALGFFSRLKEGLTRSTQKLTEGITGITAVFKKRRLDDAALDELEDVLIAADLGTEVARRVIASFRRSRFGKEVTDEEIKQALARRFPPSWSRWRSRCGSIRRSGRTSCWWWA